MQQFSRVQANLPFLIISKITNRLPTSKIKEKSLNFPHNLKLADSNYSIPGDLLLEASVFWELLERKQIRSSKKAPILQETSLDNIRKRAIKLHASTSI